MNDRLGGTTTDYDEGNIRYYGASPDNYIYFNCSDYSDKDTCELWRIIGVFDGKLKLIRNESIGSYSFDTSGSNDWSQSSLMRLLNENNEEEFVNNASRNMIEETPWYLGGNIVTTVYPNKIYEYERGTTIWTGKIALMYPSDYGYAVDLGKCSANLYNYSECKENNWLFNNNIHWLLTPHSNRNNYIWNINANGDVRSGGTVTHLMT